MIWISDYRKSDGSPDWESYEAALKAERDARADRGEICYRCGALHMFRHGRALCYDCQQMDRDACSVTHDHRVRCPQCKHVWMPEDIYQEGDMGVTCPMCDHEFDVAVSVTYHFESPALIIEPIEEDEEESAPANDGVQRSPSVLVTLSREEWIEKYGGQALLDSEGFDVVPCVDCTDPICHGWKVVPKPVTEMARGLRAEMEDRQ